MRRLMLFSLYLLLIRLRSAVVSPGDSISDSIVHSSSAFYALRHDRRHRYFRWILKGRRSSESVRTVIVICLLLSRDVEMNPGPTPFQPVASVPLSKSEYSTKYKKCLICQKPSELSKADDVGIARFMQCFETRKLYGGFKDGEPYCHVLRRLDLEISSLQQNTALWHSKSCYSQFCNKAHLDRLQRKYESKQCVENSASSVRMSLRGWNVPEDYYEKCAICGTTGRRTLTTVAQQTVAAKFSAIAVLDDKLSYHVANDMVIGVLKYHRRCLKRSVRKAQPKSKTDVHNETNDQEHFKHLISQIDSSLRNGDVFNLTDVAREFASMNETDYSPKTLREKLIDHYGDRIQFHIPPKRNESTKVAFSFCAIDVIEACENDKADVSSSLHSCRSEHSISTQIHHVGLHMNKLLNEMKPMDDIHNISEEEASRLVPDDLRNLLRLCMFGDDQNPSDATKRVYSVGQDILYHSSVQLTPKHVGSALLIHNSTRSKDLVEAVHKAGHCIGYDTLLRVETALAEQEIERHEDNNGIPVPPNMKPGVFTQFASDNLDKIEQTRTGKDTFHVTNTACFQRTDASTRSQSWSTIRPLKPGRNKTLKTVPEYLNNVPPVDDPQHPNPNLSVNAKYSWFRPETCVESNNAKRKDLEWIMSRRKNSETKDWRGYNQSEENRDVCVTGYLPMIHKPAHEYGTIAKMMKNCMGVANKLQQTYTVISLDEGLFYRAKHLIWKTPNEYKNVILRLGSFHTILNFLKCIGKYQHRNGLEDMAINQELFGEKTAETVFDSKHYNRGIRNIKTMYEALWRRLLSIAEIDENVSVSEALNCVAKLDAEKKKKRRQFLFVHA